MSQSLCCSLYHLSLILRFWCRFLSSSHLSPPSEYNSAGLLQRPHVQSRSLWLAASTHASSLSSPSPEAHNDDTAIAHTSKVQFITIVIVDVFVIGSLPSHRLCWLTGATIILNLLNTRHMQRRHQMQLHACTKTSKPCSLVLAALMPSGTSLTTTTTATLQRWSCRWRCTLTNTATPNTTIMNINTTWYHYCIIITVLSIIIRIVIEICSTG